MTPAEQAVHGISKDSMAQDADVRAAAVLFGRLKDEMEAALTSSHDLEKEESWAFLDAMQRRATEQVMACMVLYSHGYYAPAEALCRTVIEAALNLYYCSQGDTCDMVLSYFKSYINTERKQNRNWAQSVDRAAYPETEKREHRQRIDDKEEVLAHYERVVAEAFSQINRSYEGASDTWPSIFDRYKAIGKDVSYRTVYAALCSQAHNDAEGRESTMRFTVSLSMLFFGRTMQREVSS
jgi:hypothetical protein